MPSCGGIIGIAIAHGLNNYDGSPEKIFGATIEPFKKSEKSFFTYKIDNVDFAEVDLRILNADGLPSAAGRVEFRLDGYWGTICSIGTSNSAAKLICKKLNYLDGFIKNPPNIPGFCSNYNGANYCGSKILRIHYMSMNCQGFETDILQCYRDMANNACTHADDLIVECTNVDSNIAQIPDVGTIRLLDPTGMPAFQGIGRLEYFKGTWGTVCNSKFTNQAAIVACKQMGFSSGEMKGIPNQNGACGNQNGQNYCGEMNTPIVISDINCKGTEINLRDCGGMSNPSNCNHQMDIVIECQGTGDPSGKSQKGGNQQQMAPPPMLGKLPFAPIINAECNTLGNSNIFKGDPGSIYLVNCPIGCAQAQGPIWGTGIYSIDSSICKAAIHSGVNQDNMGGLVLFIKAQGITKYEGNTNRELISSPYSGWKNSFCISKANSIAIFMSQAFANKPQIDLNNLFPKMPMGSSLGKFFGDRCSFLQTKIGSMFNIVKKIFKKINGGSNNINNVNNDNNNDKSGINMGKNLIGSKEDSTEKRKVPPGIFEWVSPPDLIFDGKSTEVKTSGLPGVIKTKLTQTFSIAIRAQMTEASDNKEQTLIGHSGCGGYAIVIEEDYEIVFKIRCQSNEFKSGFRMPLKTFVDIVVEYDGFYAIFYIVSYSCKN